MVSSVNGNSIVAFDSTTGAPLGVFASGGGISGPFGLAYSPDNNLYVASNNNSGIYRFNGATGAPMGLFASGVLGGVIGITFGPDGNLYASSIATDQVLRYNGTTGAFMNVFASGRGRTSRPGIQQRPSIRQQLCEQRGAGV